MGPVSGDAPPVPGDGEPRGIDPVEGDPELDSVTAEAVQRPGHPAAYASNWKQILLVDASMGVAVFVAGVVVMALWSIWIGAAVGAAGAAYVYAVLLRYRRWKATRVDAGLPT
jgi:Flp pilus assembly protein TadB